MKQVFIAVLLAAAALQAGAAGPIYRCGSVYSQVPCPDGKLIDSADPRSAAQRAEARRMAAWERRRAAELERERRAREAAAKASAPAASANDQTTSKRAKPAKRIVPLRPASAAK